MGILSKISALAILAVSLFPMLGMAQQPPHYVVIDFDLTGNVSKAEAGKVYEEIRSAIREAKRYSPIDNSLRDTILQEWEARIKEQSVEAAVEIGRVHGVALVVTGTLVNNEDSGWAISMVFLDVKSGARNVFRSIRHPGTFATFLQEQVRRQARSMAGLGQTAAVGSVQETSPQPQGKAAKEDTPEALPLVTYLEPVTNMEFVWVPAGRFQMGCGPWNEGKCNDDEKPLQEVRLIGFWIGRHEVTQGQWARVMGGNPAKFKRGENYPVERVSWNDVQRFIEKLNGQSSNRFRLPSEAEWEYVCRAGGKPIKFSWGNGEPSLDGRKSGNVADQSFRQRYANWNIWSGYDDGFAETSPVGSFVPNALGVFDMTGNVWEWVQDQKIRYGQLSGDNPTHDGQGTFRVVRGGGWSGEQRYLWCSNRPAVAPSSKDHDLGFRLVRAK